MAATFAAAEFNVLATASSVLTGVEANSNSAVVPWYRRVTRWGQVNITEKDPAKYDIAWWRNYWKRTQTQGVIINAGGIVAYYPTKVPLHRQAQYLNGIDLFGDLCRAAHEDGLAVFARMDSNRAREEFYKAHPDWFAVDGDGMPYRAVDMYITCVNSPYYNEHIPAILKEIAQRYHPEGFTDNSWSGLGRDSICYCAYCQRNFQKISGKEIPRKKNWDDQTYREWIKWNYNRRLEIWELNNKTTKAAGGDDCIWSGMNSGSINGQSRSFRDFRAICKRAEIVMLDDQARRDNEGFQHNAQVGKLIHGMLGWEKLVPESMAMYQAHRPWFRVASKPEPEARMWVIEGIAGGIQPWWHMIAASHDDRRMYHSPEKIFNWHKTNEEFLINRQPVAGVGVVWSQENADFYGRDQAEQLVEQPYRGITQALIRARIPFVPVHADDIERDSAALSLLILPNVAAMSGKQVAAIQKFVSRGGSIIATGETSLYNEWGMQQNDYALADIFGAHVTSSAPAPAEDRLAGEAYHTYLRLVPEIRDGVDGPRNGTEPAITGKRHPVLNGFEETDIIAFGGLLRPLKLDAGAEALMTYIPQFPVYPPETAWMRVPRTDIPGLILNTSAQGGRIVFMPADIDRQFERFNLPDHGNLLANLVRWASKENILLEVEGPGLIDCNVYQQPGRLVVHLVNLTSAATWRAPLDEFINVGPLRVKIKLPAGVKGTSLRLLVSDQKIPVITKDSWSQFEIQAIADHEVIVLS
ncbi:beta-galactosidase [Chryseolinea sp. T2]|uniref:beta-galactosidase n=1 Tax=Chryseolinea sp. T2 TaxID=3129255 RepID=UPI003077DC02